MLRKRVLEWQAPYPDLTRIVWGLIWSVVLLLPFWPEAVASSALQEMTPGSDVSWS